MSTLASPTSADPILDTVVDCLTPDMAKRILALKIEPAIQSRVDELAAKANAGALTDAERADYEDLIERADLLGILKSLARQVLAR